jgi:hypothetical protein
VSGRRTVRSAQAGSFAFAAAGQEFAAHHAAGFFELEQRRIDDAAAQAVAASWHVAGERRVRAGKT